MMKRQVSPPTSAASARIARTLDSLSTAGVPVQGSYAVGKAVGNTVGWSEGFAAGKAA